MVVDSGMPDGLKTLPKISIIVLSFNGLSHLPECMESIQSQTQTDFELIIIDNASGDGTVNWLQEHYSDKKLILSNKNLGYCAGMNLGVAHASGKYVFLLNQDLKLHPEALQHLFASLEESSDHIIGAFPMVRFYQAPQFINAFGAAWHATCHWRDSRVGLYDNGQYSHTEESFGSIFPAIMFKRDKFLEIGGFDESFWSYDEDFDVCYRANILGYKFLAEPHSVIFHKYRASSSDKTDPYRSQYWFIRNYFLVFLKNYEIRNLWKFKRIIYMRYIGHNIRNAYQSKNIKALRVYFQILFHLLLLAPQIIRKRRNVQKNRKLSDEAIWTFSDIEEFNIYHVEGAVVLSKNALQPALGREKYSYRNQEKTFTSV